MSNVFFISDLHLGHRNLVNWRMPGRFRVIEEHDEWLIEQINSVVKKGDVLWVLGDVAWNRDALLQMQHVNGIKQLILGNHDEMNIDTYLRVFHSIKPGLCAYKGLWLSHAPIHPDELRFSKNVHGHVHKHSIPDNNYINVCVEALDGVPIAFEELPV